MFSHEDIGKLHKYGLAREYTVRGNDGVVSYQVKNYLYYVWSAKYLTCLRN